VKTLTNQPEGFCDLVTLYKDGSMLRVQSVISDGSSLSMDQDGYWAKDQYNVPDCAFAVKLDVNNDGYEDLVTFRDLGKINGKDILGIEYWAYNGYTLIHIGRMRFDTLVGYPVQNIKGIVAGDFDNDGFVDDVASLYDYGLISNKYVAAFHMWLSNGTALVYQGSNGWWKVLGYPVQNVRFLMSGDYSGDGIYDISTVYDYTMNVSRFTFGNPPGVPLSIKARVVGLTFHRIISIA